MSVYEMLHKRFLGISFLSLTFQGGYLLVQGVIICAKQT